MSGPGRGGGVPRSALRKVEAGGRTAVTAEAPLNVRWPEFGAIGDDSANDSAAFAAANALAAINGGTIYVPPRGAYRVQDVPWNEGVFWKGDGAGAAILKPVSSASTTPMFRAVATPAVRASNRFTYGGFDGLEFDGLDVNGECRAISTYDLQEVPAQQAGGGNLYVWMQQLHFERNVIHGCKIGVELWGDCRAFPFKGNRIYDCKTGLFVAHNHPQIRQNTIRECDIGVDTSAMLDAEIIGATISLNKYGLCGPHWISKLSGAIDANVTEIALTDTEWVPSSGTTRIDTEEIAWSGVSGSGPGAMLTGVQRGANGTVPAAHVSGRGLRRLDRFRQSMGRLDRSRVTGCIFYQNSQNGTALGLQNHFADNFIWSRDYPYAGNCMELRGGSNRVLGNWLIQWGTGACIAWQNGTDGLSVTERNRIEHNTISVAGAAAAPAAPNGSGKVGGRGFHKTYGTNDALGFAFHGNDWAISATPADGLGGAAILIPDGMGAFNKWFIDGANDFAMSTLQDDYVVKLLNTFAASGGIHQGNTYASTPATGLARGAKFASSVATIHKDNRFRGLGRGGTPEDVLSLGVTDAETIIRDNVGYGGSSTSEDGLRTVRGIIDGATGAIIEGGGFSAVRNGVGDYTVTFEPAFADTPAADGNALAAANRIVTKAARTLSMVQYRVRDGAGNAIDPTELDFWAIGPA
ncbi:MAG: hypothetical protein LC798_15610 [Chloroflexi bacterium]|nr:hypothetical protein [Chloroflexota bacterium]